MSRPRVVRIVLTAVLVMGVSRARAATYPPGFYEELVTTLPAPPTATAFAPDGRLFVCLQNGNLRVIKNGLLLPTPFLTVTVDNTGERGLLGIAFDPQFAVNRYLYVYYTQPGSNECPNPPTTPAHNRIVRYRADAANPDVAEAGSATPIL
ncbi:MAG TPA: PQQ-dependent sugar dehydrogenase, partial [Thermoanaerobaculia bacterium]|nr:PQQ-dependent sugar dehydrogenase [Thermoanaerobaculia bacterium]